MTSENVPPLRIREADGSPNVIPVYSIILSNNLTLDNRGGGVVAINGAAGSGTGGGVNFTIPLIVSSGGTGTTASGSATTLVGMNSSGVIYDYYTLNASDNLTIARVGSGYFFSAVTNAGSSTNTASLVQSSRTISTLYPISGGGDLSVDRVYAVDTAFLVNTGRSIIGAGGLSGGGNLSADRTISMIIPVATSLGGTGTISVFTDGAVLIASGATGVYTTNPGMLYWHNSFNQLMVGRNSTGATLLVSRGFPGGTQLDWNNIFGASPSLIVENTGSQTNRLILYSNTSRLSEISFCDNRTTTDSVARGYIYYDHANDEFIIANSGTGTATVDIRNGYVGVGANPGFVAGLAFKAAGSSQFTSTVKLSVQATSGGHAVRADRLVSTGAGLIGQGDLTADLTLGINTAGSTVGQQLISSGGTSLGGVAWVNTLGAASSIVYAATGNSYIVTDLAGDLTGEFRLVQSGNSITITTAAGLITINASTGDLSVKQNSVAFPLIVGSGGTGNNTLTTRGVMIGSGTNAVQVLAALNSGEILVGSSTLIAPQILGAGSQGQYLVSDSSTRLGMFWQNSASKQNPITFPLIVGSGGTGQSTLTTRGMLIGSGANPIEALTALNSGGLYVGSSTVLAPQILSVSAGSQGFMLVTNSATPLGLSWAATGGTASSITYAATGNSYVVIGLAGDLTAERVLAASTGLTLTDGGAGGNAIFSVNTNIRDKIITFYAPGYLNTSMLAAAARIRIPFNMEAIRVDLAVAKSSMIFGVTADLLQYSDPEISAGISLFTTSANKPQLGIGATTGNTSTFDSTVLTAGSYLGFKLLQVGTATGPGSNLTMTIVARAS